jgi:hypothetical protein
VSPVEARSARHAAVVAERGRREEKTNVMQETVSRAEPLRHLSDEELARIIDRCEGAIADGSAGLPDYDEFVFAQRELARRTWS